MQFKNILFLVFISFTTLVFAATKTENTNNTKSVETINTNDTSNDKNKKPFKIPKRFISPYPWGVGVGAIFSPNPYVDSRDNILPIPVITYQGKDLTLLGPYVNYRFFRYDNFVTSAQVFLYPARFRASESNDPQIQKLNNRNFIVMAGIKQEWLTDYVNLGIDFNFDITGQTNGYTVVGSARKPLFLKFGENYFIFTPSIGVQFSSEQITDYYYGISSSESQNSGLPAYNAPAAFSPFVGLTAIYSYSLRWNVAISTRLNRLDNNIMKSPMVDQQYVFTTFLSLTYNFDL
jgi:outer membrane protein